VGPDSRQAPLGGGGRLEVDLQSVLDFARTTITRGPVAAGLAKVGLTICRNIRSVASERISHCVNSVVEADVRRINDVGRVAGLAARVQVHVDLIGAELGLVEEVEELHAELHGHAFCDLEVLVHGEVRIGDSGSFATTNALVAEATNLEVVDCEGIGIEPLVLRSTVIPAVLAPASPVRSDVPLRGTGSADAIRRSIDGVRDKRRHARTAGVLQNRR
jgi:hypothetical protein